MLGKTKAMATRRPLPDQPLLLRLLDYNSETGELTWRTRSPEMFKDNARWTAEENCARWNTRYAGRPAFTALNGGYPYGAISGQCYMAHRVIWKMVHGQDPEELDHRDGQRQNNRLANLREVTAQQNATNRRLSPRNTSGFSGVSRTRAGKWRAYIHKDGRQTQLGEFASVAQAALARKEAEASLGYLSRK